MPIFEQGYQHWRGSLASHSPAWWVITRHGVRAQFRNRWTKMAVFSAWAPAIGLAGVLILWGLIEQKAAFLQPLVAAIRGLPREFREGPRNFRLTAWTLSFYVFFQIELVFSMLLVQLVGPSLISQDLRFNAMPLYFSRPLRRLDYFFGKLGVIGVYLGAVAIVPVLLAYVLGVCFSMDLSVIGDTARLLIASLAYSIVVVVSAGTLMLAISALSRNSRFVGAIWMGIWIIGNAAAAVLTASLRQRWCPLVSYTANLKRICMALLDTGSAWRQIGAVFQKANPNSDFDTSVLTNTYPWFWSASLLAALAVVSMWVLSQRVKSLDRLK